MNGTVGITRPASPERFTRWLAIGLVALVATGALAYLVGVRLVRLRVHDAIAEVGERLGRPGAAESVEVSPSGVTVRGLALASADGGRLRVAELRVVLAPNALLRGDVRPRQVTLRGVALELPVPLPEDGPLHELVLRFVGPPDVAGAPSAPQTGEAPPLPFVEVVDAEVLLRDPAGRPAGRFVVRRGRLHERPGPEEEGRSFVLDAVGRVVDGLAGVPRSTFQISASLARPGGRWAVAVDFSEPVPLPTAVLPPAVRPAELSLGGVQLDRDTGLALRGLRVRFERTAPAPLTELSLEAARLRIELDGDGAASTGGALTLPGRDARGALEGLLSELRRRPPSRVMAEALRLSTPTLGALSVGKAEVVLDGRKGGRVTRLALTNPELRAVVPDAGALLAREVAALRAALLPDPPPAAEAAPVPGAAPPPSPPVAVTAAAAATVGLRDLGARLAVLEPLATAEIEVTDGVLELASADGRDFLRGANLDGSTTPPTGESAGTFGLTGRIERPTVSSIAFSVSGTRPAEGLPRPRELRLEGPWLALLAGADPALRLAPEAGGSVALDLAEASDGSTVTLDGQLDVHGIGFERPEIATLPVTNIRFATALHAVWEARTSSLTVALTGLTLGAARADVDLRLVRPGPTPSVAIALRFARQPCATVLEDIPPGLVPRLTGAKLAGELEFAVKAEVDLAKPDSFAFEVTGDWSTCQALTLGPSIDVAALNDPRYVHRVVEKGQPTDILVGPGAAGYVPLAEIPSYVQQTALGTEDMAFFEHEGFRPTLMTKAVRLDLQKGRYVYGGSTISQQLVKNLFLSREKTLSRKLEEAFVTWHMERVVEKERILELYLNCIEYGPGIYGIGNAAATYFGVTPAELTVVEGAFLMGLKPAPTTGYMAYQRRRFSKRWLERMDWILKRLTTEMGVVTPAQYAEWYPFVPEFHYPDEGRVRPTVEGEPPPMEAVPPATAETPATAEPPEKPVRRPRKPARKKPQTLDDILAPITG